MLTIEKLILDKLSMNRSNKNDNLHIINLKDSVFIHYKCIVNSLRHNVNEWSVTNSSSNRVKVY